MDVTPKHSVSWYGHRWCITILAVCPLFGQQQPAARIAVVNFQAVLLGTHEGKKAYDQLKAKYEARKKEFDARQNEIVSLQDQLAKSASVATEEKKDQLAGVIGEKQRKLQRDEQDASDEAQKEQQDTLQPLASRVDAILSKYAADNGYAVVFDYSVPGTPVRYATTASDITKEVIALYDKTYDGKP